MPPLRSTRKFQPHIVLNDIFKNKNSIAKRKNIVTAVGPPWCRRFSTHANEKSSCNVPRRTINLRSRGRPRIIVIEDEGNVPKEDKHPVERINSDAARTRGFSAGTKRKLDVESWIKTENSNEPDLMIIENHTELPKVSTQCEPTETIADTATLAGIAPKGNKNLANDSRSSVDTGNRSISHINANNDISKTSIPMQCEPTETVADTATLAGIVPKHNKTRRSVDTGNRSISQVIANNDISKTPIPMQCEPTKTTADTATLAGIVPKRNKRFANNARRSVDTRNRSISRGNANNDISKTPIPSSMRAVRKVATKKRGRPAGVKNKKKKKRLVTSEVTSDKANCSYIDVVILEDKKDILKSVMQPETKQRTIATGALKTRGRPSKNDMKRFVNAILKRNAEVLQGNGELVSERDPVWQTIRHELEYKVTAQTLRRIAKTTYVYNMLTSPEEKVELVAPTANNPEVTGDTEIAASVETKRDDFASRLGRALEILGKSVDRLSDAIKELRKELLS